MKRQLNPHLFQSPSQEILKNSEGGRLSKLAFVGQETTSLADSRMQQLETELFQQKKRTQELHQYIEKLSAHIQERLGNERSKDDKMMKAMEALEAKYRQALKGTDEKMAQLTGQLRGRKATDAKIEELIDRQNSVIRGFESRLVQLQKLVADQEKQLVSSAASLNEAKLEIMRLKRLI